MTNPDPATLLSRRCPSKRAFITGAASGLGLSLAMRLARDGWTLGVLDLDREHLDQAVSALQQAGAARALPYPGDVAAAGFVMDSIADFVQAAGGLDLLVNNAGVAVAGAVEATPVEDWQWITGINLLGVVWGCRAALPVMKQQRSGVIFNIASSAGFAAAPQMSAYNVTKAGVIALSETLVGELAGSGIQVSCAMPGFFRTHLLDHMHAPPEENRLARQLMDNSGHDANEAAAALLGAVAAGDLYVIWPPEYRWAWRLKRWFPRWFLKRVQSFRDAQARKAGRRPG